MKKLFLFEEFKQGLLFRIIIFGFMGIGWDVLMTFLQQIIAGRINWNAICPASVWMFAAYSTLPLFLYPLASAAKYLKFPRPARIMLLLAAFYIFELLFGLALRLVDITPWNYNWYLAEKWTLYGIITWHPAILTAWIIFLILVEWLDSALRKSYPVIKENLTYTGSRIKSSKPMGN